MAEEKELAQQAVQQEQDTRHRELIRLAREQEDRIREEGEREARVLMHTERMTDLEAGMLESVGRLQELWDSQPDKGLFSDESRLVMGLQNEVNQALHDVWSLASSGAVQEADWSRLGQLWGKVEKGVLVVQQDLAVQLARAAQQAEADQLAERMAAAQEEAARQQQAASLQAEAAAASSQPTSLPSELPPAQAPAAALSSVPSAQPSDYRFQYDYHEIKDFKAKYIADVDLGNDKKLKSELQQAVNTPLNTISAVSRDHLRDKLTKLTQLLAGETVEVKDMKVCAARHPSGIKFCMAMLAKRIVKQGEDVISSNFEAAFAFASVAVALWDRFPEFGKLLHAYFYELCPFLGPCYPQRHDGLSEKDYYTALGYKYENETIEKQDKYLKRMSGMAYLFAALSVTHLPRDSAGRPHPFGPRFIWRYLAAVMNLEPQADVTATVLLKVLEATGHLMFQHYGVQFLKLLLVLQVRFLPKLEAVKTDGGPTSRLEAFLMAAIPAKTVPTPKGKLDSNFL